MTPSRTRVLVTKLAVGALYAAAFFVASLALVAAMLGLGAAFAGTTLALDPEVGRVVWQGLLVLLLTVPRSAAGCPSRR